MDTLFAVEGTCQLVEDPDVGKSKIGDKDDDKDDDKVPVPDYKIYQCECTIDLTWNVATRTCVGGQGVPSHL